VALVSSSRDSLFHHTLRSLTFVSLFSLSLSKHYTGRGTSVLGNHLLRLIDTDERLFSSGLMKRFDTVEQVAKEMNLPVDKVQGTFNDYMEIVKDPKKDPFGKKLFVAKNRPNRLKLI